jgi:hypothetical protein
MALEVGLCAVRVRRGLGVVHIAAAREEGLLGGRASDDDVAHAHGLEAAQRRAHQPVPLRIVRLHRVCVVHHAHDVHHEHMGAHPARRVSVEHVADVAEGAARHAAGVQAHAMLDQRLVQQQHNIGRLASDSVQPLPVLAKLAVVAAGDLQRCAADKADARVVAHRVEMGLLLRQLRVVRLHLRGRHHHAVAHLHHLRHHLHHAASHAVQLGSQHSGLLQVLHWRELQQVTFAQDARVSRCQRDVLLSARLCGVEFRLVVQLVLLRAHLEQAPVHLASGLLFEVVVAQLVRRRLLRGRAVLLDGCRLHRGEVAARNVLLHLARALSNVAAALLAARLLEEAQLLRGVLRGSGDSGLSRGMPRAHCRVVVALLHRIVHVLLANVHGLVDLTRGARRRGTLVEQVDMSLLPDAFRLHRVLESEHQLVRCSHFEVEHGVAVLHGVEALVARRNGGDRDGGTSLVEQAILQRKQCNSKRSKVSFKACTRSMHTACACDKP